MDIQNKPIAELHSYFLLELRNRNILNEDNIITYKNVKFKVRSTNVPVARFGRRRRQARPHTTMFVFDLLEHDHLDSLPLHQRRCVMGKINTVKKLNLFLQTMLRHLKI